MTHVGGMFIDQIREVSSYVANDQHRNIALEIGR